MTEHPIATAEQLAVVQSAQDTGHVHMLDLTEDDYAAAAWPAPSRGQLARTPRDVATAASVPPEMLVFLTLARLPQAGLGLLVTYVEPEPAHTSRRVYRINLLREAFGAAVACVERLVVPLPNDPSSSLPISIDLLRFDRLLDMIVDEAFRGPATTEERDGARGAVTTVALGEPLVPSTLTSDWSTGTAVLTSTQPKRFGGGRTSRTTVSREQYAEHVMARLMDGA